MKLLADLCSILFVVLFLYALVVSHVLRMMIDEKKWADSNYSWFRSYLPPREVLTEMGQKFWWSRLFAFPTSFIFLAARIYLDTR